MQNDQLPKAVEQFREEFVRDGEMLLPEDGNPERVEAFLAQALANQQQELLEWVRTEVIGEDEEVTVRYSGGVYINGKCVCSAGVCNVESIKEAARQRNVLRAELRAKVLSKLQEYEV